MSVTNKYQEELDKYVVDELKDSGTEYVINCVQNYLVENNTKDLYLSIQVFCLY